MIRRTLRNGLVAALAAVALFPAAAVAAPAGHSHAWGSVTTRHYTRLNVRSGPGTGYRIVGTRPVGRVLPIVCKTRGSGVFGNHRWYKLPHHEGYVSAHYVRNHSAVRWC
ncbi:SH3 domain-containing protein [Streptomyces sp. 3213.3]|uniref:SH3 domain-containing protein n=1 Tax=Streptomyces sp. 3213.3 TaxID=1855348 RepID=UPI000AD1FA92|nr:SH3 domain-containing protein [Streptomyces sp. 3213.3]